MFIHISYFYSADKTEMTNYCFVDRMKIGFLKGSEA